MRRIVSTWAVGTALLLGGCAGGAAPASSADAGSGGFPSAEHPCLDCQCPDWSSGGEGDACGRGFCGHPRDRHP